MTRTVNPNASKEAIELSDYMNGRKGQGVLKEQYNHLYAVTLDKLPEFGWVK